MVKIRLKRTGKTHEPHFRIVAQDSRHFRSGKVIQVIGYYNPRSSPSTLTYDKALLDKWITVGAQMSDTVNDIFVREGIFKQSKARVARIKATILSSKKQDATKEKATATEPKETKLTSDKAEDPAQEKEKSPEAKPEDQVPDASQIVELKETSDETAEKQKEKVEDKSQKKNANPNAEPKDTAEPKE